MKNKIIVTLLLSAFNIILIQAQPYTINGFVEDSLSGETLVHASIVDVATKKGVVANDYGFYSITSGQKKIQLQVSYVGYKKKNISIYLNKDTVINIHLSPSVELEEVIITGYKGENIKSSQISISKIDIKKASLLPVLVGETDLIKTIQLLPGIQSGTEGTGGLFVRGGSQGDNLVLLDGAPVYNVNHLWGFFSVFNTDAIQNAELYKGGFPAKYGGRLSSVLDIKMKEGNNQKFSGSGSIGLITSKLTLEGPIIKDKTSFIISGRRTYFDLVTKPLMNSDISGGYYFYDANIKVNHRFSTNSRLYLSFYTGKDVMDFEIGEDYFASESTERKDNVKYNTNWGNITSSLRWNYIFNSKLFLNTTLIYSKYQTNLNSEVESNLFEEQQINLMRGSSNIQNQSVLLDFSYFPNPIHSIKFGGSYTYFAYLPVSKREKKVKSNVLYYDTTYWHHKTYPHEIHAYIEDDIEISSKLKSNIGIHASLYNVNNKWYSSIEPRVAIRYMITPQLSFKSAYTEMNQYVFQYPNIMEIHRKGKMLTLHTNPEIWLPATDMLPPQKSRQLVAGIFYSIPQGIDISVEGFYKLLYNVIEDSEFDYDETPDDWEDLFETGKGKSYGIELLVEKKVGKSSGWVAYTLSKTERQFDNLNNGETYPYIFDRRHNINVVINHKFSERFDIGIVWVYGSGRGITLTDGQYVSNFNLETDNTENYENDISVQSTKNAYRMPAYHRLDIGFNFHKQKKWGSRIWSLGLYNAYNHHNSFLTYVDYNDIDSDKKVVKSISFFPIMPYVNYSFKF